MASHAIATLGPEGTYSALAARIYAVNAAPDDSEIVYTDSISEAVRLAASRTVQACVVPIENAIGGNVTETLDALYDNRQSPMIVTGEEELAIHHGLFGLEAVPASGIRRIYSHRQGLAQCKRYLASRYPDAELVAMNSTVAGMSLIAEQQQSDALAIGPEPAAQNHGLRAVDTEIEDHLGNKTRFLAFAGLANELGKAAAQRHTFAAVVPRTYDSVGQLADILQPIKEAGINLSLVESRSHLARLGSHMFYLGMELAYDDGRFETVAAQIRATNATIHKLTA